MQGIIGVNDKRKTKYNLLSLWSNGEAMSFII